MVFLVIPSEVRLVSCVLAFIFFCRGVGSINGPCSSETRSSSSSYKKPSVVRGGGTRLVKNGDGRNEFDLWEEDAADDADADDDGSIGFNSDADADADADVDNKDTGANADDDDEDDTVIRANDPCKLVSTVIGDTTSCRSVIKCSDGVGVAPNTIL